MISGVIAEFNPFHNGHNYLLSQASGLKIVVMSGNWTQRGEPAIVDKWTRAQMALENGADIIVELPFFASVQSADYFAEYAIGILSDLGVEQLVFGTDSDHVDYDRLCHIYKTQSEDIQAFLDGLPDHLSYPQKTQKMWEVFTGIDFDGNTPNHILALAYTKAIAKLESNISLQAIPRIGSGFHDDKLSEFASATAIRAHADSDLSAVMPSFQAFESAPKVAWTNYFSLLKYKVMSTSLVDLPHLFQVNDELAVRLKKAIKVAASFDELVDAVATKRYTKARIRRLLTYILINVSKSQTYEKAHLHILGFSSAGRAYLKDYDVVTKVGKSYTDSLTLQADAVYRLGNVGLPEQNYGRIPIMRT